MYAIVSCGGKQYKVEKDMLVKVEKIDAEVGAKVELEVLMFVGDEGEDIVCAAVSSVIQTAVLGLMRLSGIDVRYEVDEKRGYLSATLPEKLTEMQRHDADLILRTAYLGVSDLYEGFSDFINLEVD